MKFTFIKHNQIKIIIQLAIIVCIINIDGVIGQNIIKQTFDLKITGRVISEKTFNIHDLDTFAQVNIDEYILYNKDGSLKNTLKNLKGIPIKSILKVVKYAEESPRSLNEYYFILKASDGYKVVFSWNEIYNTDVGNNLFIITEIDGKKARDLPHHILFLSCADIKTGLRYIKCLENIEVKQIE
ncbi:MAG TPA: hypothetical protein PKD51_20225 [Saprospiraceae bacterium]|nr:hypothetical protein [Saprospiraceae bacterium]HMU02525.1 hypothetical protein [Saprospiraceae bacterium]